jgi:hypothetical protein
MTRQTLKALLFAGAALPLVSFVYAPPAQAQEDEDTAAIEAEVGAAAEEDWDEADFDVNADDEDAWDVEADADTDDTAADEVMAENTDGGEEADTEGSEAAAGSETQDEWISKRHRWAGSVIRSKVMASSRRLKPIAPNFYP